METISQILARELGQKAEYVDNVIRLLDEGLNLWIHRSTLLSKR